MRLTGGGVAVQKSAFEVASDAFNTFKRLLTQHDAVGEFLQEHHSHFFKLYEQLLQSKNYATQRQVRGLWHRIRLPDTLLAARPCSVTRSLPCGVSRPRCALCGCSCHGSGSWSATGGAQPILAFPQCAI